MNEYVVSINNHKREVRVERNQIILGDKKISFELQPLNSGLYLFKAGDKVYEICYKKISEEKSVITIAGRNFDVLVRTGLQEKAAEMLKFRNDSDHHSEVKSPMPGLILKVKKKNGDNVEAGEPVMILEAMKMENELRSPSKGKIREILVQEGIAVEKGAVLFKIDQ
jgi:biotin carboxyl carrier protein